jgi:hypothetical protein
VYGTDTIEMQRIDEDFETAKGRWGFSTPQIIGSGFVLYAETHHHGLKSSRFASARIGIFPLHDSSSDESCPVNVPGMKKLYSKNSMSFKNFYLQKSNYRGEMLWNKEAY